MPNALRDLLGTPTVDRTADDYERAYDDFVAFAGGHRVSTCVPIPPGHLNADYHFELEPFEILLELKQITAYRTTSTVQAYFRKLYAMGHLSRVESLGDGRIRFGLDALSRAERSRFLKKFRPQVTDHLRTASAQLKATDALLPAPRTRRLRGVVVLNTGDFNLPTDLLATLVGWHLSKEWRSGHLRSIDFAGCLTVDMFLDGRHPLHSRYIASRASDEAIAGASHYLFERWLHYAAQALGGEVRFEPGAVPTEPPRELARPFRGKIKLTGAIE